MMGIQKLSAYALAVLVGLVGVLAFSVAQASADLGEFSLAGSFKIGQTIEGIAVDESTNDVYLYGFAEQIIYKVDEDGNPVNFSGLGTNEITEVGSYGTGEAELAVDNSSGPAKGDIYLAGGSGVKIFGADGKKLGEITQVAGRSWGEVACGVAVDGSGRVDVGLYNLGVGAAVVNQYTPIANPVTNEDYTASRGGLNEICEIAASPKGAVYASTWNPDKQTPIVEFDSIQAEAAKEIVSSAAGTLAVANSPGEELFFSHRGSESRVSELAQYDSSGNPLGSFSGGDTMDYFTLTVNAKNGRVYAYAYNLGTVQIWQGIVAPEVRTGSTSGLNSGGNATLDGTVNPEGVTVEGCSFEYGPDASYGSTIPCSQATPFIGTSTQPVSAEISGLQINHTYHYRVSASDSHGTLVGADQTFAILVRPVVEDQQPVASAITRSTAKLTGTINPEEGDTNYHFEYGTSESYGNSTASLQTGSSLGDVTVNDQLTDLIPDTVYHYRLVAKNVGGLVDGADHTFRTGSPIPPTAFTGSANGVAQNTATITGTVDAGSLPTTYGFEIGTSTDYGPPTGLGPVGAGSSEAQVSLALTGLLPGTTYHYRVTAANVDGTTYGADQTFTTGVFASTFAEPPAPLPFVSIPQIVFPSEAKPTVKKPVKKKAKKKVKKRSKTRSKKPKNKKK